MIRSTTSSSGRGPVAADLRAIAAVSSFRTTVHGAENGDIGWDRLGRTLREPCGVL